MVNIHAFYPSEPGSVFANDGIFVVCGKYTQTSDVGNCVVRK